MKTNALADAIVHRITKEITIGTGSAEKLTARMELVLPENLPEEVYQITESDAGRFMESVMAAIVDYCLGGGA